MNLKSHFNTYIFVFCILFLHLSCTKKQIISPTLVTSTSWVNANHLEKLYATAKLANGTVVGTVGIYADYPAYNVVSASNEGYTCIDDVARAALFYLNESDISSNIVKQDKLQKLTEFVLQLQADNGYFYNFLQDDYTINQFGQTSIANANWWSWRALWHLSAAYTFYKDKDTVLANRIQISIQKLTTNIKTDFGSLAQTTKTTNGLNIPTWLPSGSGTDQAAVMLLGLWNVYVENKDTQLLAIIEKLGAGIIMMQQGDKDHFPYGAFLSWENTWHAYGSDQAQALIKIGKALNKQAWIDAGQKEVDNFYPYLLNQNFLNAFTISSQNGSIKVLSQDTFAQISYGIRPMISATLEAYQLQKDPKYLTLAAKILAWYGGNNLAKVKMYDKTSGVCFDGISSANNYNKNSGAESTIEALWAFQLSEKFPNILIEIEKYQ